MSLMDPEEECISLDVKRPDKGWRKWTKLTQGLAAQVPW